MSLQTFITIFSACMGLLSAIWFGAGAAFMSVQTIAKMADDSWDAVPGVDTALVSQSAQYLTGGLLLLVGFGLQIVAALTDATTPLATHPYLGIFDQVHPAMLILAFLVLGGFLSCPLYACARKRKGLQAKKAAAQLQKNKN